MGFLGLNERPKLGLKRRSILVSIITFIIVLNSEVLVG